MEKMAKVARAEKVVSMVRLTNNKSNGFMKGSLLMMVLKVGRAMPLFQMDKVGHKELLTI